LRRPFILLVTHAIAAKNERNEYKLSAVRLQPACVLADRVLAARAILPNRAAARFPKLRGGMRMAARPGMAMPGVPAEKHVSPKIGRSSIISTKGATASHSREARGETRQRPLAYQ